MRIWLASFPRSGNHLLRGVLRGAFGIGSDTVYPDETAGLTAFFAPPPAATSASTRFTKTHELAAAGDPAPAIYLVRDGRDAYVSYARYAFARDPLGLAATPWRELLRAMITSAEHFGGWSTHVESWKSRRAPTTLLRYEELVADPLGATRRACAALNVELPPAVGEVPSGEALRAIDPTSFRRGGSGHWREELPPELELLFWRRHGGTLRRLGYRR